MVWEERRRLSGILKVNETFLHTSFKTESFNTVPSLYTTFPFSSSSSPATACLVLLLLLLWFNPAIEESGILILFAIDLAYKAILSMLLLCLFHNTQTAIPALVAALVTDDGQ